MGITAFKGFEHDLTCRGFQYEIGKTYRLPEGELPDLCNNGFHASIRLPEVFDYYPPITTNRYCEVELDGFCPFSFWEVRANYGFARMHWDKLCAAQITIKRELSEKDIETARMVRATNFSSFFAIKMDFEELTAHHAISFRDKFFKKDKDSELWYTCDESCEGAVTFEEFWNNESASMFHFISCEHGYQRWLGELTAVF